VVAQRLVRKPCGSCAAPYVPSPRTLSLLGLVEADLREATPVRGKGCSDCAGTGYRGRTGVFEVLPITAQLRSVLLATPTEAAVGAAARAHGMMTLRASALAAAHRGDTTYEEVLRATHVDTISGPRCPSCSRALADDMQCCPFDGTPVGRDRCGSCDRSLDADWKTCPWCRTAIADREDVVVPPPSDERLPRLLVIDDDPSVCAFVEGAMTGSFEVVSALTAETGLALVSGSDFDVAIVDHGLPDMTGVEVIRLLRSDPSTLNLPVLLLTGDYSLEVEREARRAGANDFLAKPVEPVVLEERMLALVHGRALV
jgi:CheY-like chemotaxis protein